MRAAVLTAKERLEVEARDDAPLAAGEVRVRIANGGICGSDLHYFHHYRMGDFPVIGPFVLGHEGAGTVAEIGPGVSGLTLGDTVAVNPSQACGDCECCRSGRELLCSDMRFIGSSRRTPHMQGLFTQHFVTPAAQCVPVGNGVSAETAAFAEPLSVALHAAGQAGPLLGRSVLITGSGPIGSLICIAVRLAGARHVTMADVLDEPLKAAEGIGADRTVNLAKAGDGALIDPARPRGHFDVAFDAATESMADRPGHTAHVAVDDEHRPGGQHDSALVLDVLPGTVLAGADRAEAARDVDAAPAPRVQRQGRGR